MTEHRWHIERVTVFMSSISEETIIRMCIGENPMKIKKPRAEAWMDVENSLTFCWLDVIFINPEITGR